MAVIYRKIEKRDNEILSRLIKRVFEEFGIDIPGTVYTDPTTDAMYELFQAHSSVYWIAEENDTNWRLRYLPNRRTASGICRDGEAIPFGRCQGERYRQYLDAKEYRECP